MSHPKSPQLRAYEGHPNAKLLTIGVHDDHRPVKPKHLTKAGEQLWDTTVVKLIDSGVATSLDQSNLESLCYWWSVFLQTQDALDTVDDFSTTAGQRALNSVSKAFDNYRRLADKFGLNPQARNSINATPHDDLDDYE